MIIISHPFGITAGEGSPGCNALMGSITALIFLKSLSILHFPDFFLIMKTGEFQRLVVSTICPSFNCSSTRVCKASIFYFDKGHCSTHTGLFESHFIFNAASRTVAPRLNFEEYWGEVPY